MPSDQIAVRIPQELLASLDALVADGVYPSRAAAVRAGIEALAADEQSRRSEDAIIEGYERVPPSTRQDADAAASLRDAILEEPW